VGGWGGGGPLEFAERNVDRTGHEVHRGDVGEMMILNGTFNSYRRLEGWPCEARRRWL